MTAVSLALWPSLSLSLSPLLSPSFLVARLITAARRRGKGEAAKWTVSAYIDLHDKKGERARVKHYFALPMLWLVIDSDFRPRGCRRRRCSCVACRQVKSGGGETGGGGRAWGVWKKEEEGKENGRTCRGEGKILIFLRSNDACHDAR